MGAWDKSKFKTYDDTKGRGNPESWKEAFKIRMGPITKQEFAELTDAKTEILLKKAYRKLAVIHHPDKGGDVEQFKKLSNLYDELMQKFKNNSRKV